MRAKPAVVNGAPRSDVKAKADFGSFALEPAQGPHFVAPNGMRCRRALLRPTNGHGAGIEVDLVPAQVRQFARSQTVTVGYQDHRGVPVTPAVGSGGFQQPLDLGLGQVLAGARRSALGRRFGVTVRFTVPGATNERCDFAICFAPCG
jgi:hypothetical protein